jgi:shikimate kinase
VGSVREAFDRLGESGWREAERDALTAFLAAPLASTVLALGGGAPTVPAIAELLLAAASAGSVIIVLLEVDPAIAAERLARDPGDRTSLTGQGIVEELAGLDAARRPIYRRLALRAVNAGTGSVQQVAETLIAALR